MAVWILVAGLFSAAAASAMRDPRRLHVGILLLAAVTLAVLAGIAHMLVALSISGNETAAAWFLLGILVVGLLATIALAAFLVYTGLVMLRKESRRVANLLSLILGLALFAYVALGFGALFRGSSELITWILLTSPPIGYLGFIFASYVLYAWFYGMWARHFGGPVSAVVVLGAGLSGDQVTPLLASRLTLGKKVLDRSRAAGSSAMIIVSGGQGPDERISEAEAMAKWLQNAGVAASRIIEESRSTTTEENIRYSLEVLHQHGITGPSAVVTNNYHAFRAATLMSSLRMPGFTVGAPTARYFWPTATIREFIALLRDHLRLNAVVLVLLSIPAILAVIVRIASI